MCGGTISHSTAATFFPSVRKGGRAGQLDFYRAQLPSLSQGIGCRICSWSRRGDKRFF